MDQKSNKRKTQNVVLQYVPGNLPFKIHTFIIKTYFKIIVTKIRERDLLFILVFQKKFLQ